MRRGAPARQNGAGLAGRLSRPGCYSLIFDLKRPKTVRVGKLGAITFAKGIYVYTGSAINGLGARLRRHCRREKKRRWHIDYLLALPETAIKGAVLYPATPGEECRQNQRIAGLPGATIVHKRFGATDCKAGCASHLSHFLNGAKLTFASKSIMGLARLRPGRARR